MLYPRVKERKWNMVWRAVRRGAPLVIAALLAAVFRHRSMSLGRSSLTPVLANNSMTELIAPLLPLLALMFGVLLFVTDVLESFMWLPRIFGFALRGPLDAMTRCVMLE